MFQTIKEYFLEFTLLPKGMKFICYIVFILTLTLGIYLTVIKIKTDRKINQLEKMNTQLEKAAVEAQSKARNAEFNAASENLRSLNLEAKLKELEALKTLQANEIKSNTAKVTVIRNSINHLRVSQSRSIGTDELERRLEDRYRQTKSN